MGSVEEGFEATDAFLAAVEFLRLGFIRNEDFFAMMEYLKNEISNMEGALQEVI